MTLKTIVVSCDNILCMKDSHWPVFTSVKTNSSSSNLYPFDRLVNVLTSFHIGIAVSELMLRLKAKEFSDDPSLKRPSVGTSNGSAAIPSAFASKQHSLSISQKIWSSKHSRSIDL